MFPLLTLVEPISLIIHLTYANVRELMLKRTIKEKGRSSCVGMEAQLLPSHPLTPPQKP